MPTARAWYARKGRPVAIVIPTYGDPALVARGRALAAADHARRARADHRRRRRQRASATCAPCASIGGIELVEGAEQRGFAANCNRGIERLAPGEDLVLLNSDVIAHDSWLEALQYTAYQAPGIGIVGPKLLYPDGTIQSAGSVRNPGAPRVVRPPLPLPARRLPAGQRAAAVPGR